MRKIFINFRAALALTRKFLTLIKKHLNGDFAYQNYLKTHQASCSKVLSKKEFLLNQQEEKWKRVNRCC